MRQNSQQDGPVCLRCGQRHRALRLRLGQRANCAQCGANLRQPSRFGPHALPALALTALLLAIPAGTLPLVTLNKLGNQHAPLLLSGVDGLIQGGMSPLAALVGVCAMLAPVALAGLLASWWWMARAKSDAPEVRQLLRLIEFITYWSMPEVYVLGVLIAFVKLGEIVHAVAGAGLWCYGAMAAVLLAAWRTFVLQYQVEAGAGTPCDRAK